MTDKPRAHSINLHKGDWFMFEGHYFRVEKVLALNEGADLVDLQERGIITSQHKTAYQDWLRNQKLIAILGTGAHQ